MRTRGTRYLRRECGAPPPEPPDPEREADWLFARCLVGVGAVAWWILILVLSSCAHAPAACPPPTERVVTVPEPVKCDVPVPALDPFPKPRKCGDPANPQVCYTREEGITVTQDFERLADFVREYLARCAK